MIEFAVNDVGFRNMLADFAKKTGVALPQVVRLEARLLLKEVIKWTPPFKNAETEGAGDREIGKNAVQRDISMAIAPLVEDGWKSKSIRKLIAAKDSEKINAFFDKMKGRKRRVTAFEPSFHKLARNKRTGRVTSFQRRYTFEEGPRKKYIKEMQKRVGAAKGSWAEAYAKVGGKPKRWTITANNLSFPSSSTIIDATSDPINPSFEVTSTARGVTSAENLKKQINFAMRVRTKAMASKMKRMMSDPEKYANLFAQYK